MNVNRYSEDSQLNMKKLPDLNSKWPPNGTLRGPGENTEIHEKKPEVENLVSDSF